MKLNPFKKKQVVEVARGGDHFTLTQTKEGFVARFQLLLTCAHVVTWEQTPDDKSTKLPKALECPRCKAAALESAPKVIKVKGFEG